MFAGAQLQSTFVYELWHFIRNALFSLYVDVYANLKALFVCLTLAVDVDLRCLDCIAMGVSTSEISAADVSNSCECHSATRWVHTRAGWADELHRAAWTFDLSTIRNNSRRTVSMQSLRWFDIYNTGMVFDKC